LLACAAVGAAVLAGLALGAPGDLDPSFGSGGKVLTDLGGSSVDDAQAVAFQSDGKIVAFGSSDAAGSSDFALVRYNADGSVDLSFGSAGKVLTDLGTSSTEYAAAVAIQPDGRIVAAGASDAAGADTADVALVRYTADGSLDPSFGSGGKVLTDFGGASDRASAVAIEPDGKIVAAGASGDGVSDDFALVRYNADGSLDLTFGRDGKVLTDLRGYDTASAVAIQPDGRIVAAGLSNGADPSYDFALVRYNADGSLDPSFGSGGAVLTDLGGSNLDEATAVAIQQDAKIVAAGVSDSDFALVRYNADGSLDRDFGSSGKVLTDIGTSSNDAALAVAIQPDARIIAAGYSTAADRRQDFALVRYDAGGSLDPSFGSGGKVLTDFGRTTIDNARAIAIQPDGKLVAAGFSNAADPDFDFALARYLSDGTSTLRWRLASDFGTGPNQHNPNPDSYGNLGVWRFLKGATLHDRASYSLLGRFIPNAFAIDGLEQWQGPFISGGPLDRLPAVGKNTTGSDQHPFTITWPAGVIRVHPVAGAAVIVGWHSPVTGKVRITVSLSDLDPGGGDGIRWYIDKGDTTLASGRLDNGGQPQAVSLATSVHAGTNIYVIVTDGGAGDFGSDSTGLGINIHT
jgi:uncharacterized delta-60 repeat protein